MGAVSMRVPVWTYVFTMKNYGTDVSNWIRDNIPYEDHAYFLNRIYIHNEKDASMFLLRYSHLIHGSHKILQYEYQ